MGAPMARHLLAAGFPLTVHSRSPGPVDALVEAGAERGRRRRRSSRAYRTSSITMLPDTPDVEHVMLGDDGVVDRRGGRVSGDRHEHDRSGTDARDR